MIVVPLDKSRHDRNRFDCGVKVLNNYLKVMANQQSAKDNTRTYILEDSKNPSLILGFYTLTTTSIDLSSLLDKLQKKHQNARAAGLIARLAVDQRYTKKGYGEWLLIDALRKLLEASDIVGFPIVIVDAKDGAAPFYTKFGFIPFRDTPNKLFVTISSIRNSLTGLCT
jgi:GNAT superfamily N-acetyltransferase